MEVAQPEATFATATMEEAQLESATMEKAQQPESTFATATVQVATRDTLIANALAAPLIGHKRKGSMGSRNGDTPLQTHKKVFQQQTVD
jgi:hypothetical protein